MIAIMDPSSDTPSIYAMMLGFSTHHENVLDSFNRIFTFVVCSAQKKGVCWSIVTLPVNSRCTSPYHFSIGSSYRLKNLNIVRSTHLLVAASFVFRVIKRVHGFCYCLMYLYARSGWSIFAKYRRIYMYICIQIECILISFRKMIQLSFVE